MFLWLWGSCIINGDAYLIYNRGFILGILLSFVAFFLVIPSLPQPKREHGLQWLAALYCAVMLMVAALGLYVAISGTPFTTPLSDEPIQILNRRLFFFRYHPNEVGSAFVIALYLLLYLFAALRNAFIRIAIVLSALLLALTISCTASRTAIILSSVGVAVFIWMMLMRRCSSRRKWAHRCLGLCISAVVLISAYYGTSLAVKLIRNPEIGMASDTPQADTPMSPQASEPDTTGQENAAQEQPTMRERVQLSDLNTLNMRTEIWQSGLDFMKAHPRAFLFGVPDNVVARIPQRIGRVESHMHNAFLEMLLLGGIPGFALYLSYLALLIYSGFRLSWNRDSNWARRFLGMVPLLLTANGVTEIYPLFAGNMMDIMYFAISGAVIALASDCSAQK